MPEPVCIPPLRATVETAEPSLSARNLSLLRLHLDRLRGLGETASSDAAQLACLLVATAQGTQP